MSTTIRLQDSIKGSIEILSIDPPFSFFNFQENHFPNAYALKRLLSQVRAIQGKSMVIEMLDATTEIKEENEDSSIRCNFQIVSDVYRLSFFKDHIKIPKDIEQLSKDSFVGYIIIKRDFKKDTKRLLRERIFESIIAPSRFHNNFIHRKQQWEVKILGVNFSLNGYLYAQQNDLTNVCAHVAVRTAAACYHPNGDMLYREMNNLLGIDHRSRKVGEGRGLSVKELIYLMEQAGARCFLADYESTTEQPVPFQRLIYGSIESGFPSLVVFCFNSDSPNEDGNRHQSKHVIPIFGHTFNEDTWLPNANYFYFKLGPNIKYIPSDSWLSMFIGHDDNFGSNFCIPPRYLTTKKICKNDPSNLKFCPDENEGVSVIISTAPKEVLLSPLRAEALGAGLLFPLLAQRPDDNLRWTERLESYANKGMLVLRTILIKNSTYIDHLKNMQDWEKNRIPQKLIEIFENFLSDKWYWLIELSLPELFPTNKRKIGEILIRSNTPFVSPQETPVESFFVLSRLPSYFALYEKDGKYSYIKNNVNGHVDLFYM